MKSSLKHYGSCKIFLMIVAAVMFCGCFFSCSKNITVSSLTGTLDEVDRYIIQGQSEAALKLLVKTDKKWASLWLKPQASPFILIISGKLTIIKISVKTFFIH